MVMDREKVLQALREAQAEYNIEDLDEFIRTGLGRGDIVDAQIVAELTERAVEILFDQDFLWVHIIESEDQKSGFQMAGTPLSLCTQRLVNV
jgi:hypothetical protein